MVATPIVSRETHDNLSPDHFPYFLDRGFNFDHIQLIQSWGVRSINLQESLRLGIKKYDPGTKRHLSDGGIWFPFTSTYGQVRFNTPLALANRLRPGYRQGAMGLGLWMPLPRAGPMPPRQR